MSGINGSGQVPVIAEIVIRMGQNGQVNVNAAAPDPLAAFFMLSQAGAQLAIEYKKQAETQIQAAPPGIDLSQFGGR